MQMIIVDTKVHSDGHSLYRYTAAPYDLQLYSQTLWHMYLYIIHC